MLVEYPHPQSIKHLLEHISGVLLLDCTHTSLRQETEQWEEWRRTERDSPEMLHCPLQVIRAVFPFRRKTSWRFVTGSMVDTTQEDRNEVDGHIV